MSTVEDRVEAAWQTFEAAMEEIGPLEGDARALNYEKREQAARPLLQGIAFDMGKHLDAIDRALIEALAILTEETILATDLRLGLAQIAEASVCLRALPAAVTS